MLQVYDCYDAGGNYRDEENPLIWVGSDEISQKSLPEGNRADATYSFDKLTTNVSCTLRVSMTSGTTALGSSSDPFMSRYPVSGIGMYALLTDEEGSVIPAGKVDDVTLTVSYQPSSTDGSYGYKVQSGAGKTYSISLNAQDAEDGHRTVSQVNGADNMDWQYVGVYRVDRMSVTLGGQTKTYTLANNIGLPAQYTLTTAGPAAENITLRDDDVKQRYTVLGKVSNSDAGAVNGTFLQAQDPGVTAKVTLTTDDGSDTQYVILDNVSMQLNLSYKDGKSAPNGGYSWTGTSQYEAVTVNMTNTSGTYATAPASMLAGRYGVQLQATVNGATTTKTLKDIAVYSKAPTVKITAVSPAATSSFQINTNLEAKQYADTVLVNVQNYLAPDGKLANVYIEAGSKT